MAKVHLSDLLANTSATLEHLSHISASFRDIESQARILQAQSNGIIEEQRRSEKLANEISQNLQYYEPLDRITRRLNAPGAGGLVRNNTDEFSDILRTIDVSLEYMEEHVATHKDAATYRSRYRLLLTRALTLVRNTFMAAVRDVTTEVAKRIADKQLNDTTMSALLYAKFRVDAADMKALGLEIQKRANPPADADVETEGEYMSLMNELHTTFAACRARLILPIINKQLAEIMQAPSSAKDLTAFARSSISYVRGVCADEFELWRDWFHGNVGLYDKLLEPICEPLFDYLQPKIIHETRISKLCQLVSLLQNRYIRNLEDDPEEQNGFPDANSLDFSALIQPALEDAQTRLVFRTLAVLHEQIENYKPTSEDVDYPRRVSAAPTSANRAPLSGRRKVKYPTTPLPKDPEIVDEDSEGEDSGFSWTPSSLRNTALQNSYPTLPRAVRLLSRIYHLVNSSVFDDLAHQIVHQTTISLHTAAALITQKSTRSDAQLFLLKHLLLLKSQIVAFDIEFVAPDVSFDFSGVTSTFYELRERGGLFNPRSWIRLVGGGLLPRVVENMLDAKVELDGRLRTVINDFCHGYATTMTKSLPVQPTKKLGAEDAVIAQIRKDIESEVPMLRAKLEQYLDDHRTKETLVAAVQDQVVQQYESFYDSYVGSRKTNVVSRKGKGKGREDAVWDIDTFAEWAESVFNVTLPNGQGEEVDGTSGSRSLSRSGSS